MSLIELLSTLRSRDITVWADGERLRYSAPSGALTSDIREELAKHKADLLTFLNEAERTRRLTRAPITKAPREAKLLPSINQRRFWFIEQLQPNTAFNSYKAFRIQGSLNIAFLERSFNEIIRRHEVLRTTFAITDGEPVLVITQELRLNLTLVDLCNIPDATVRDTEAERIVTREVERPFDLGKGPLMRAYLVRLGADEHLLLITMHHIVTDGWSTGILLRELTELYEALRDERPSSLPDLPIQYADFAHWQSQWLQGEVLQQELSYWKERLKGVPEVTELPTDYPRPSVQNFQGTSEPVILSKNLTQALKTLSQEQGVTLFMTLAAAFKTLLYRYNGQEDLVLASPTAGRVRIETENLIGLFINTLVLRTDLSGNPSFLELLKRIREVALGAYAHQEVPFEKLIEDLRLERSLSVTPLFQVMFVLQNTPGSELRLVGSKVTPVTIKRETALSDLFLALIETKEGLRGTLSYRTDLFNGATIRRMIGQFQVLLHGIVADPDRSISTLPLLTATEKRQLLVEWNDTNRDAPNDECLQRLFEEQAERTPEAVAVAFRDQQLSYRDLNRRANQVAHYLNGLGVGAESRVGICAERSLEMAIGVLGILKAGAAYVPLDFRYPTERLAYMLKDSQVKVVLTQQRLRSAIPVHDGRVIALDADWPVIAQQSEANPENAISSEQLAYVIYTSGSTGEPKGVLIPHGGVVNHGLAVSELFALSVGDRVSQCNSLSFDISVEELFSTWISGGAVILCPAEKFLPDEEFAEWIAREEITVLNLPTAFWHEWIYSLEKRHKTLSDRLRLVVVGGDKAERNALVKWQSVVPPETRWLNTYGPSEATVTATVYDPASHPQTDGEPAEVPIGRPIAGAQAYVLGRDLEPVPIGVAGELYIGGAGIGRGYLNRPEQTAESFIPNPFSEAAGERLYRTGDLCRYLGDGNIEFLGRVDQQIKIRGYRVEPGEIESVLSQYPAVRETVVMAAEERQAQGTAGSLEERAKRLVAYVVANQGFAPTAHGLRGYLKDKLPEYMVPVAYVFLNTLPLTANGKLDRKALTALDSSVSAPSRGQLAPRDELELQLTKLWERVLKVRPVGIRDNFFDLGGHSLLAVRLFAQMEKIIGKELPLATLFRAPTIEQLAGLIRQHQWSAPWKSLVAIQPGGSRPPFVCLHAHDGGVLFWRDLARHLGSDQPFYALQPRGLDGKEPLHTRIEEMAAHYIQEIRSLQPEGPYYIGGHCIGGLIAFEMAQQLHAQGETVGLLALFDSYAPHGGASARRSVGYRYRIKMMRFFETVGLHLGNLSVLKPEERMSYLNGKFHKALYKLYMAIGWAETARQRRNVLRAAMQAARSYQASVYPGAIALFRATRLRAGIRHDAQMGWGRFAGGGLEAHLIPGYHAHIVLEPRVRVLARELIAALKKAQPIEKTERMGKPYPPFFK